MRGVTLVLGLVILGSLAMLFQRDIETRAIAEKALAQSDKAQVQTTAQRAALGTLSEKVEGRILPVHRTRVSAYYHDSGFTRRDAEQLAAALKRYGFEVRVARHPSPGRPDAVFIGAAIAAEEAQLVLSLLPYDVEYLMRLDYPRQLGGDPDGRLIGIGYLSTYTGKGSDERARPTRITRQQLASLLQPRLSNTEFQLRLRRLAGPQ